MKTMMIGAAIAFAGMLGAHAQAEASPMSETIGNHLASNSASGSDGSAEPVPNRPGAKTHFPRNGMKHNADDDPVTGQGPNKIAPELRGSLGAALGNGS